MSFFLFSKGVIIQMPATAGIFRWTNVVVRLVPTSVCFQLIANLGAHLMVRYSKLLLNFFDQKFLMIIERP